MPQTKLSALVQSTNGKSTTEAVQTLHAVLAKTRPGETESASIFVNVRRTPTRIQYSQERLSYFVSSDRGGVEESGKRQQVITFDCVNQSLGEDVRVL